MRNLRSVRHRVCRDLADADIAAVCWDAANDEVLVAHGPTGSEAKVTLVRVSEKGSAGNAPSQSQLHSREVTFWYAPSPNPELDVDKVVSLHHFSDTVTSCVVFAGGDIITVQEKDSAAALEDEDEDPYPRIELVGSIDAGIKAARWSPDEELLVIATAANNVLFLSRSFDAVAEANFSAEDLKLSKHVSVGWGKKETQFQGKGAKAKALRDPTIPEKVDEGVLSSADDGRTTISWRGDGAFVAINSVESSQRRVLRVYSREGVLDSVSEPVDGLEGSLSWRPAGNLIASIQRLADRVDVVFFERNGLRHGQFTLRDSDDTTNSTQDISLEWNSDSTVLAVALKDRVQLWTMGNYHWYLKQEILCGFGLSSVAWHPEKALSFAAVTPAKLFAAEYVFTVARGPVIPPYDFGAVAVIDGQTVKITPFRTAQVPPPMSLFDIDVGAGVVDVAFAPDSSAMAVLHHGGVKFYTWETEGSRPLSPKLLGRVTFDFEASKWEDLLLQLAFSDLREVLVLKMGLKGSEILSCDFSSPDPQCSKTEATLISSVFTPSAFTDVNGAVGQDRLGKLYRVAKGEDDSLLTMFPIQLPWVEVVEHDNGWLAFGLSRNGHLYANSRQLAKNCTSFLVTRDHLILTTNNHLLKFVHLTDTESLEVPPDDPENDERCRSIERGAKLVTGIPTNMNLVLQMPRGNLETICPRAMVLAGIRQLVDEKNYGRAFSFCRTQRVDMNLLYDHRPEQFLANTSLFLEQLKDVTYIDLFLSSLRSEDVTKSMYKDTKPAKQDSILPTLEPLTRAEESRRQLSKVNTICDAVLKSLRAQKNANLQNIITAHVCKTPPAVEDGLTVVAELMQEDETLAERAVEHVCFLVDVNRVYDQALGLYNLDLALLVAQQSQRDPREYLPFIQKLHQMDPLRRQFTIDDHLERHHKALAHLQKLQTFDEVTKYTIKHELYQTALGLYRYDASHHKILTDLYASYLESKSKFREAGLAYESLGNFTRATACYQQAGSSCWRECLFTTQQQQEPALSPGAFNDLASSLAEALQEAKDYAGAATIFTDYLHSTENALRCLCKGYHFADALRLVALHKRPDLLETAIDTGLADALSSTTEFLADCNAQLKAQIPRILELRRKALEDPLAFYEGERGGGVGDVPDDVSVAASSRLSTGGASLFTRYTGKAGSVGTVGSNVSRASSKNRKREEKKRARGRKGTVYEQEYLVNSVRRLVERVNSTQSEVERLVFGLARRGMAERARAVEALMADVLEACRAAVGEVWPAEESVRSQMATGGDEAANAQQGLVGDEFVMQDPLEVMSSRQDPPVVGTFARLSLLGS